MKKALLILGIICTSFLNAQTTAIPDANFEQALINLGYDTGIPDGTVPTASIDTVAYLSINTAGINDLTGIGDFIMLSFLDCGNNLMAGQANQLTTLDLSNNTALTDLHCTFNQLTTLDVSNNSILTNLYRHS